MEFNEPFICSNCSVFARILLRKELVEVMLELVADCDSRIQ